MARALAADPPVLLMDEPFGAVDPITRSTLQDELLRLQSELRKTIVFVTHDFGEAVKLGDRIAVLGQQSKVLQYDTPQNILASPGRRHRRRLRRVPVRRCGSSGCCGCKDVALESRPTVHRGDTVEHVRSVLAGSEYDWAVVLDDRQRPVSWVRERRLRHASALADAVESLDVISTQSTLEDALEAILAEQHASAVVAGAGNRYEGVVTLDTLIDTITRLRAEADASTGGEDDSVVTTVTGRPRRRRRRRPRPAPGRAAPAVHPAGPGAGRRGGGGVLGVQPRPDRHAEGEHQPRQRRHADLAAPADHRRGDGHRRCWSVCRSASW